MRSIRPTLAVSTIVLAALALAGCSTGPQLQSKPGTREAQAEQMLYDFLAETNGDRDFALCDGAPAQTTMTEDSFQPTRLADDAELTVSQMQDVNKYSVRAFIADEDGTVGEHPNDFIVDLDHDGGACITVATGNGWS